MKNYLKTITVILVMSLNLNFQCEDDDNITPEPEQITVTDIDGNTYETVEINGQIWMAENLKVKTLNDGTAIDVFNWTPDDDNWWFNSTSTPMYSFPFTGDLNNLHDEELSNDFYGLAYSHAAIETGKLAPEGWRIPTEADFMVLESYLEDNGYNIGALKSNFGWTGDNNGTNELGFNGLPNGYTIMTGSATGAQAIATFSTATTDSNNQRLFISLLDNDVIGSNFQDRRFGGAIRCIKVQ